MTTTNVFQGLAEGKNSSRVLRPPGGQSSNIFGGGDPEPQQGGKPVSNRNKSSVMDGACELGSHQKQPEAARFVDESAVDPQERIDRKAKQGQSDIFNVGPVSSDGGKRRGQGLYGPTESGYNPITGQNPEEQSRNAANIFGVDKPHTKPANGRAQSQGAYNPITGQDYPTTNDTPAPRVRQPPGGASSGLW